MISLQMITQLMWIAYIQTIIQTYVFYSSLNDLITLAANIIKTLLCTRSWVRHLAHWQNAIS